MFVAHQYDGVYGAQFVCIFAVCRYDVFCDEIEMIDHEEKVEEHLDVPATRAIGSMDDIIDATKVTRRKLKDKAKLGLQTLK